MTYYLVDGITREVIGVYSRPAAKAGFYCLSSVDVTGGPVAIGGTISEEGEYSAPS